MCACVLAHVLYDARMRVAHPLTLSTHARAHTHTHTHVGVGGEQDDLRLASDGGGACEAAGLVFRV